MVDIAPHQLTAIRDMHNGCVLLGGVGTGKTRTALAYYVTHVCQGHIRLNNAGDPAPMQRPKDVYVITPAKKRDTGDWEHEASNFGVSTIRDSSYNRVQLTVDSFNNMHKYTNIRDAFFIIDEQKISGSGAWVKAFLTIARANEWIVLSATPGDAWIDYVPIFLANGFYKNRTEFYRQHVVMARGVRYPRIDRYIEQSVLETHRRRIVVSMPMTRHTVRHVENIMVSFDKMLVNRVFRDRWHVYEERPLNDAGEMLYVLRKVVNSDVSRLAAVLEIAELYPKLIIFYSYNYELDILRQLHDILNIPIAEYNGHRHDEIPEGNTWLYLVNYSSGAESWNCTTTNTIVFYSLQYSWRVFEQAQGRIDRMNTPFTDLNYFVLRSASPIDNAIITALARKEIFNGQSFLDTLG